MQGRIGRGTMVSGARTKILGVAVVVVGRQVLAVPVRVEEMEVEAVGCWMLLATSLVIEIARERAGDGLGADGNNFSTLSHCDGGDLVRLD